MASYIFWSDKYIPGTIDNFMSNEESYYDNCSQISPPSSGPSLSKDDKFSFSTFGFPPVHGKVPESEAPSPGKPGRLAWEANDDGDEDSKVDVYHAWIVEDLEGGRVRVLTQESQIGKPFKEMATKTPVE